MISIKRKRDSQVLKYALLNTLEFNSTRKRMSVVVKDMQTQKISILCKGADSIIKKLLATSTPNLDDAKILERTQKYVDIYAQEGLRTLLLAKKDLD